MPISTEISRRILFICALYNFLPKTILPKSIWDAIKQNFRSRTMNDSSESKRREMSPHEKLLITDCIETFYIRVRSIDSYVFVRDDGKSHRPRESFLDRECRIFIGCLHSYLHHLDGRYLENYGVVKVDELVIESVPVFTEMLKDVVKLEFLPKDYQNVACTYLDIMYNVG